MTIEEFFNEQWISGLFAGVISYGGIILLATRIWNSPDDPRGQQLTFDQIFRRK